MKDYLKLAIFWLLSIAIILSGTGCNTNKDDNKDAEELLNEESSIVEGGGEYDSLGNYVIGIPDKSGELSTFKKQNSDAVAWLQVPNTTINDVVVQTNNNDFYVRRNALKQDEFAGCYYIDYESKIENGVPKSKNTIIYGHNLGNPQGTTDDPNHVKFAQLLKLNDEKTARKTPYFYFTTDKKAYLVEIFAVFYSEAVISPVPYHYADYTAAEFQSLIADVKARSQWVYEVDVSANDQIVTLSTCTYKYGTYSKNPNQRYVVMGRIVQAGEEYRDGASITPNPTPKAPKF